MKLADIALTDLGMAQHIAMNRLHLKLTGDTHALLLDLQEKLQAKLLSYVIDEAGTLNPLAAGPLADFISEAWREMFRRWRKLFEAGRQEAASLPLGSLARYHQHFFGGGNPTETEERRQLTEQGGATVGVQVEPFFRPQLREVLEATAERVYGDGFRLSQRIWHLDERSLAGIQQIVTETLVTGDSAWNAAQRLEAYLGMGQDCPRWTSTRLFKLTKADIARGDQRGLIRANNEPCASKGVAYNALRLARNEIQIVHAAATDAIFAHQPWVVAEKVNLSPSHPPIRCECEEVAAGGENGNGVYPKGSISLPIHVQCLCFKTAELIDEVGFAKQLKNWMTGQSEWPEMDGYANWIGASRGTITTVLNGALYEQLTLSLLTWLTGSEAEVEQRLGGTSGLQL